MASSSKKPTKQRQTWLKEDMIKAISAYKDKKMGFLKASKEFNVPKTTLRRLVAEDNKPLDKVVSAKLGRKPIFPLELEESLVDYTLQMEGKLFGLTRNDIKSLAFQLALKNNIPNPFSLVNEVAGRSWLRLFLKRHPLLSFRQPTGTSFARASGFSKENVDIFFNHLEKLMVTYRFSPDKIFNVDETGISVVPSKMPKVLALKGRRQIGALTSGERGSLITAILCMSAGGSFVPPMFIFPRKRDNPILMKGAPPGSIYANHPSGWVQTNLFTKWFKHFFDKVKPSASSPVLLIMDGHASHTRNIELVDLARNNHVHILSIPPHSSHKIQPLDKTFMGPLKKYLTEEIRRWVINNARALTHFDIIELFGRAYLKTQAGDIAVNGFASTGICPFDKHIFKDHDFLAAEEVDGTNLENPGQLNVPPSPHEIMQTEPDPDEPSTSRGIRSIAEVLESNSKPVETELHFSEPSSFITPHEISPIPIRTKKISNRGRKRGKSEIISSSPYKLLLEESMKKKGEPKLKKPKAERERKTKLCLDKKKVLKNLKLREKKINRKEVSSSSESEEDFVPDESSDASPDRSNQEDAKCIYCCSLFSDDKGGEEWVQCVVCTIWAHEDCSGNENKYFICEFCSN
ncbi:tigger transposable element-derived protein 6-like [Eupeodes corollae]|uniref:tigger transposable element-derived protein 6-like n=1 Tax=Eupeodes corollae TaxID=290404 RepID=UPI002493853D|nr:tigger transposable element-derived protein 6-like [Eupeodes corollae]XP_055903964.1 tigger transposable element-derived protein 6-like [Eupeodes corollae]